MFAAALPALTNPVLAASVCGVLGAVGMLIFGGVGIYAVKKLKAKNTASPAVSKGNVLAGLFGGASSALNSPLVKEVEKVVVQAIHQSQHAALNAAVAMAFPGLKPFIPVIDQIADAGLAKVTGAPILSPPAANSAVDALDKRLGISPETPPDLAIAMHQLAASFWQRHKEQQAAGKAA